MTINPYSELEDKDEFGHAPWGFGTETGGFTNMMFPLIRKSFPRNPINDLVGVQGRGTPRILADLSRWKSKRRH